MNSDLRELYQEIVLEHSSRPHNFRKAEGANRAVEGFNPLCGDRVTLYLQIEGDVIKDVSFQGSGCAISRASTSMMTEAVKGKSASEVQRLFEMFHSQITGGGQPSADSEELGDLEAFSGLRNYPARVKCGTLAWHALRAALEGKEGAVSTE